MHRVKIISKQMCPKWFVNFFKLTYSPIQRNKQSLNENQTKSLMLLHLHRKKVLNKLLLLLLFLLTKQTNKHSLKVQVTTHNCFLIAVSNSSAYYYSKLPIFSLLLFFSNEKKYRGQSCVFLPVPSPLRVWTVSRQFIDPTTFKDKAENEN
jgi:hypothetical protein